MLSRIEAKPWLTQSAARISLAQFSATSRSLSESLLATHSIRRFGNFWTLHIISDSVKSRGRSRSSLGTLQEMSACF